MEALGKSTLWLCGELASPAPQLHILDCRSRERYDSCHVARALSVALPGLLLRRLRKGKLSVRALLPPAPGTILLYDEATATLPRPGQDEEESAPATLPRPGRDEEESAPATLPPRPGRDEEESAPATLPPRPGRDEEESAPATLPPRPGRDEEESAPATLPPRPGRDEEESAPATLPPRPGRDEEESAPATLPPRPGRDEEESAPATLPPRPGRDEEESALATLPPRPGRDEEESVLATLLRPGRDEEESVPATLPPRPGRDEEESAPATLPRPGRDEEESVLATLLRKLREEGCTAYYLQGGFSKFQSEWPDHCETSLEVPSASSSPAPAGTPVVGLGGLSLGSDGDSGPLSGGGVDSEAASPPSYPVQILPHLYLGSARDSANMETLARLGIRYILNVTPNLPNLFEEQGGFHYKQIPISDHWSQNLARFFPEAIAFIDEAVSQNCGILVHCLAGVSRSVTVTVAYLMQRLNLSLNDAYDLVKRKKADISPNFNFMGQLLDFERELGLAEGLPATPGAPAGRGQTPTSSPGCFFTPPPSQCEEEDGSFQRYPT